MVGPTAPSRPFLGIWRREALFCTGVAAGQGVLDCCVGGTNRPAFPPHPPARGAPRSSGKTLEGGRGAIAFHDAGTQAHLQKPVDGPLLFSETRMVLRLDPVLDLWIFHRLPLFFHRSGRFFHMGLFGIHALSLSSSSFLRGEREERRGAGRKTAIHRSIFLCVNVSGSCERYSTEPVDDAGGVAPMKSTVYRDLEPIHRFFRGNALVPLFVEVLACALGQCPRHRFGAIDD